MMVQLSTLVINICAPYAVQALFIMLVFIVFSILLLLLYPMRFFQQCLGCCRVRWYTLHMFIDAFQGCYIYIHGWNKWNLRLLILCRCISHCPGFAFHHVCIQSYSLVLWWSTVHVHISDYDAIMQNYKPQFSIYNAVDSALFFLMALWCATFVCISIAGWKLTGS